MLFLYVKEPPASVFTWLYKKEGCLEWTLPQGCAGHSHETPASGSHHEYQEIPPPDEQISSALPIRKVNSSPAGGTARIMLRRKISLAT